ncbi:exonuclease domain-containing protein, partial [Bacillus thuringiensis]|uniref:exonuclease domain-containing protein n=1 Tax=Bacillus thuringiensis TaxID=1428 RepID=UPI0021B5D515
HELVHQFVSYLNPERPIPHRITSLTAITNYRLSHPPTIQQLLPLFLPFLHTNLILAHNPSFHIPFFKTNRNILALPEPQNKLIHTLLLPNKYINHAPNHKLQTLNTIL